MALSVGELQVLLTGDTRKLNRDLDQLDSRAGKTEQIHTSAWKRVAVTAGAAIAAVGIGAFVKDTVTLGNEYQGALNQVQAVTGATAKQMAAVRVEAKALGADMDLPATSAKDAASAMEELAKGGLNVEQSMKAAKGTLQLAAAAQIDGAAAAGIQSNALNTFRLSADQANHVADVLANTANMSSGSISDFALGLQQAGSVAHLFGISLEDTSAALGIFANAGLKGSDGGTSLKTMLTSLTDQGKPAQAAIKDLGLTVYDAQGKFVGLAAISEQLTAAHKRMTQEQFNAAAATLFGTDAIRAAGIMAELGAKGFNDMSTGVSKAGGASDLAAAQMKGLGGAWQGFKSQFENFQLDLYERAAPNIEKLVRYAADKLPAIGNAVLDGVDKGIAGLGKLKDGAVTAFEAIARYVSPVTDELDDLWASLTATHGPAQAAWGALKAGGTVLVGLAKAAHPAVALGGQLLKLFNALPGPVQTAVLAFGALKVATSFDFFGRLAKSEGTIRSSLGGAGQSVAGFAQTVRMNMRLAGDEVGGLSKAAGGLSAGFQTYLPNASRAVSNFSQTVGSAFEQAKQLQRFKIADMFGTQALAKSTGDLAGFNGALKSVAKQGIGGLKSAGSSLVGFLGGPWGVALAGGALAVSLITSKVQQATDTQDKWAQALGRGGAAAAQATAAMHRQQAELDDNEAGFGGFINKITGYAAAQRAIAPSADDATKANREWFKSLSPVEQAQSKVAEWTSTLSYRLDKYGEGSDQVTAAQGRLAFWTGQVATRQGELDAATTSATGALEAQTAAALAGANVDLAASQANTQLATAQEQYNQSLADGTLTATQHQQATDALTAAAYGAAAAAAAQAKEHSTASTEEGKQAAADAALLASLQATAQQLGTNTPAAITNLIASLQKSAGTASTTSAAMRDLGIQVTTIPGSKDIIVRAPTEDQKKRLADLGYTVTNIPGSKDVTVHANTADAEAALNNFVNRPRTAVVQVVTRGGDIHVSGGNGPGGTQVKNARGNILHAYANGGIEPLRGGLAQLVPPGALRVIGDNLKSDEAYIPLDLSARSNALWEYAGRAMGRQFLPASGAAHMASAQPGNTVRATGTGPASVRGMGDRHYHLHAVTNQAITPRELVRLQEEADALYG